MKNIADNLHDYLRHLESRNFSPSTVSIRRHAVTEFILHNKIISAEDIVPSHVRSYQALLAERNLADNTRVVKLTSVRSFLTFLRERDLILLNVSSIISIPRVRKALPKAILTEEEVTRLLQMPMLNSRKGLRLRAIVELFYGTGIRRGELLNLNLYDLAMKERTLFVRQGKGKKDRVLPVPKTTLKHVGKYITTVRSRIPNTSKALFVDRSDGTRLVYGELQASIYRLTTDARKTLGMEKRITCHVFRHSIATHLMQRGVDIRYVQAFLGHERLETTQIYTRVAMKHAANVIRSLHPREKMKIPLH